MTKSPAPKFLTNCQGDHSPIGIRSSPRERPLATNPIPYKKTPQPYPPYDLKGKISEEND
jgi:hypothetical protein